MRRSPPRERDAGGRFVYRHGHHRSPLYNVWGHMWNRCISPTYKGYEHYGGRGITVCEAWKDFAVFAEWAMANGFEPGLNLDRRENDAHYTPDNCRFVTAQKNQNNRSNNRRIVIFGETKTLAEWSRDSRCSVKRSTLAWRLSAGWVPTTALTAMSSHG